jgi:regulator of protease activity HflC (stomatin/prohibitin superfamily)
VNAVAYFNVVDPSRSVLAIEDYIFGSSQVAQTTLRSMLGQVDLDELLSKRKEINQRLQRIIDEVTEPWGVKVTFVEVKDVELPESMRRAMARQAEAERERRAKVIHAEGELQASEKLLQAAQRLALQPQAMQLRYLQTLTTIAADKNSTIVFPLPVDLLGALLERMGGTREG